MDRLTLEVTGAIAQNGVCLGDVNGDGDHELVVGNDAGELFVFKGSGDKVWRKCSDLGFITAVGVGDLLNCGHNVVVVVSGCGWVNIIDFSDEDTDSECLTIMPTHTQRLPANVKDLIICDVNADGSTELVVSLTDRVVRTYRWVSSPSFPPSPPSSLPASPQSSTSD